MGASLVRITVAGVPRWGVVVWLVAGLVGGTATVSEAVVRTAVGVVVGVVAYLGVLVLVLRTPSWRRLRVPLAAGRRRRDGPLGHGRRTPSTAAGPA